MIKISLDLVKTHQLTQPTCPENQAKLGHSQKMKRKFLNGREDKIEWEEMICYIQRNNNSNYG